MQIKQRFNVKNVEGWLILFWWAALLGLILPYLVSEASDMLVLLGFVLCLASAVYTKNYLTSRITNKENHPNA